MPVTPHPSWVKSSYKAKELASQCSFMLLVSINRYTGRSPSDESEYPGPFGSYKSTSIHWTNRLPRLPFLSTHRHDPVKQLISERTSRDLVTSPVRQLDFQPIGNLAVQRPPDDQLRFPAIAAKLLQLGDIRNSHAPQWVEVLAVLAANLLDGRVGTEGDCRDGSLCADVDVSLATFVSSLEIDRPRRDIGVGLADDAQSVLGGVRSHFRPHCIRANGSFDATLGCPLEEAEDLASLLAVLGILRCVDVRSARLVRCTRVMLNSLIEFLFRRAQRRLRARCSKLLVGDLGRLLLGGFADVGRRGQWRLVGLADPEKSDGELGVRGHAL